uniref:uncharacterized protein LOC122783127 n=1 Tax=Solea senegalensis TaxID=28829 RepID=UPI001CD8E047|nr:uncharacterized protein LOC122783127 [Solea senegalensis]
MTTLLTPSEQLMREISSHLATTADVIPSVVALKRLLSRAADTDSGVRTAKDTSLEAVNQRFGSAFSEPLYYLATILDPRYKDRYFDTVTKQAAINMLQKQVDKMTHSKTAMETPDTEEPQEQKGRTSNEGGKSLLDMHDEILEEHSIMELQAGLTSNPNVQRKQPSKLKSKRLQGIGELDGYLACVSNQMDLLNSFPHIKKLCLKLNTGLPTSAPCERLFSCAGLLFTAKLTKDELY